MDETRFIDRALSEAASGWRGQSLGDLAALTVPDGLLGRRRSLLRADIGELWAKWFVESLVDPRRYTVETVTYPRLFADVLGAVNERFGMNTLPEKQALAASASSILQRMINLAPTIGRRRAISRKTKSFLIDVAGERPRCWVCGSPFDPVAIDNFIGSERSLVPSPLFIDVLCPRGLSPADLSIQIDHIVPVAHGGTEEEDNLALACGWCNRHKSAWLSIYDVEGRPRLAGANTLGITSLPQPFWSIRHIATIRECEHPGGCGRNSTTSAMTIAPSTRGGALNPTNLRVTCHEHDPIRGIRLQPAGIVRSIWGKDDQVI